MLVTVTAFREPWEAHMFRSRLSAEGIPAYIAHEFHVGNAWHYSTALGGVKVQVPEERVEDARAIDALCREGEFEREQERYFGNADAIRCPKCASTEMRRRHSYFRTIAAGVLFGVTGIVLPPTGWVYFCAQCGTKFKAPLYKRPARYWLYLWGAIACAVIGALVLALLVRVMMMVDFRYWLLLAIFAVPLAARRARKSGS